MTGLISLILRDPRCRPDVEITDITDWMAFDRLMSGYGYSCRLNWWRKRLLKIVTTSWRDNRLLHDSFFTFVSPTSPEELEAAIRD